MTNSLAPIVLFVYNRPDHVVLTIEALKKNTLAPYSDLIIYSDGPKSNGDRKDVDKVRSFLKSISGFNSIVINEENKNKGLAQSISCGVTEILERYNKVIVLEDDIITSPAFLSFMNEALDYFHDETKVWHINGFCHPINVDALGDIFMNRVMDCWGWGTWTDRWKYFDRDPLKLLETMRISDQKKFDLNGTNEFWPQVLRNISGEANTWAIFWYATIFLKKGLCVSPSKSFTYNIGFDGSGENCLDDGLQIDADMQLNTNIKFNFSEPLQENTIAISRIRNHYLFKKSIFTRLLIKFNKIFLST